MQSRPHPSWWIRPRRFKRSWESEVFAKLPKDKQQKFLEAYYDPQKGIGYTLGRTNIHSCDFSSASYIYVKEGDKALTSFDVEPDRKFRIPFIKRAIAAAGGQLTLFADGLSAISTPQKPINTALQRRQPIFSRSTMPDSAVTKIGHAR